MRVDTKIWTQIWTLTLSLDQYLSVSAMLVKLTKPFANTNSKWVNLEWETFMVLFLYLKVKFFITQRPIRVWDQCLLLIKNLIHIRAEISTLQLSHPSLFYPFIGYKSHIWVFTCSIERLGLGLGVVQLVITHTELFFFLKNLINF